MQAKARGSTSDPPPRALTVGQVAARSGIAVSTVHFYEAKGLITSSRTAGNQRRYRRDVLRRIAVIRVAQRVGISLNAIRRTFLSLPQERTPPGTDWAALSAGWRGDLDERIVLLTQLRNHLSNCIGCGCLSLGSCPLYNPKDRCATRGPGPGLLKRTRDG